MKRINNLFSFIISAVALMNSSFGQTTCSCQLPGVVSNPEFTVYDNPVPGSRPLSDVCAWSEAFGSTWHNSPVGTVPPCATIQTSRETPGEYVSGMYEDISIEKDAELMYDINIQSVSVNSGDAIGHIDELVVCLTNEDPTTLVQNNQLVEFDKQVLFQLYDVDITESNNRFVASTPVITDKSYSKLLVYHKSFNNSGNTEILFSEINLINTTYSICHWPQYIGHNCSWAGYKGMTSNMLTSKDEKRIYQSEWTAADQFILPDGQIISSKDNSNFKGIVNSFTTNGAHQWTTSLTGCWSGIFNLVPFHEGNIAIAGYASYPVIINGENIPGIPQGSTFLAGLNENGELTNYYILSKPGITIDNFSIIENNNKLLLIGKNTIANNQTGTITLVSTGYYLLEYDVTTQQYENSVLLPNNNNTALYVSKHLSPVSDNRVAVSISSDDEGADIILADISNFTIIANVNLSNLNFNDIKIISQSSILASTYSASLLLGINGTTINITQNTPFLKQTGGFYNQLNTIYNNYIYYPSTENGLELIQHNPLTGVEKQIFNTSVYNPFIDFAIDKEGEFAYISYQSMTVHNDQYHDSTKLLKLNLTTLDTTCPDRTEMRAIYLYNDSQTTNGFLGTSNEVLITNLESLGINTVMLAVKSNLENMTAKELEAYLDKIKDFVTRAHQKGWQVHAHPTYGFCDYDNYITEIKPFVLYFKNLYQGSASIPDEAKFDGFHTDFEPFASSCNNGWNNDDGFTYENQNIMPAYYSAIHNIRKDLDGCYWPSTSTEGRRFSGTTSWKWPYYSSSVTTNPLNASVTLLTSDENFDFIMPMNFPGTCEGWFLKWYYSTPYSPSPIDAGPMLMTIHAGGQYNTCNNNALDNRAEVFALQNQMQNLFSGKKNYMGSCIFDYKRMMSLPQTAQSGNDQSFESYESISDAMGSGDSDSGKETVNGAEELVTIYPNPFNNQLTVKKTADIETTVRIYNSSMNIVLESGQQQVNTSSLRPGMYFVHVINETGDILVKTIMIKKQ